MKTIQQDLRFNNLSLDKEITVAQNRPLWRLMVLATREEEEEGQDHHSPPTDMWL